MFSAHILRSILVLNVINIAVIRCEDTVFRIRKCCAERELLLEGTGQCAENKLLKVRNHIYYMNETDHRGDRSDLGSKGTWPWWFPPEAEIISKSTNKPLTEFPKKLEVVAGEGEPCGKTETQELPAYFFNYTFYDDGSILVYPNSAPDYHVLKTKVLFDPMSFCIDRLDPDIDVSQEETMDPVLDFTETTDYMVVLCPCKKATCIRKCCPWGMLFDMRKQAVGRDPCVKNKEDDWTPVYLKDGIDAADYFILHDEPECDPGEGFVMPNYKNTEFPEYVIFSNGSAHLEGETYISKPLTFCGDNIIDSRDNKVYNRIIRCFPRYGVSRWSEIRRVLYGWMVVIGAAFLLLTLVVYYCLPPLKKKHDKSLIFQTWSLFVGYISLAITELVAQKLPQGFCTFLGFLIQYSFLSAFFWLNVLCFDISYTFSSLRIARRNHMQYTRKKQIFCFSYGWIAPALIVLLTAIVAFFPELSDHLLKPEINDKCWFKRGSLAILAYFYGPIATLLAINLFLFLFTSFKIMQARNDISTTIRSKNVENQRFLLYLKLFILMGLSWITELISGMVGGPDYYWIIPDIVNLLRAVFIFVIICCKKQVAEELKKKFGFKKECNVRRSNNTRSSSVLGTCQFGESFKSSSNNAVSSL